MEDEKKENNLAKSIFNKETIIALIIGIIAGLAIMYFVGPNSAIATIGLKRITKVDLANKIEKSYPEATLNAVFDNVDETILNKMYKLDDDMEAEVKKQADDYLSMYENYGISQEEFFQQYGFKDYDDFLKYLTLDYRRYLYYGDYLATLIEDEDIQKYYDENVYGEINTVHILAKTSEDVSEKEAKAIAEEAIKKLNNGENVEDVVKDLTDKYYDTITYEDLGYVGFDSNLAEEFMEALKGLEDNSHSQEPVQTVYGYHVIIRKDQKEKPELEKVKRNIAYNISNDTENLSAEDQIAVLVKMRDENGLKFKTKGLQEAYENYKIEHIGE